MPADRKVLTLTVVHRAPFVILLPKAALVAAGLGVAIMPRSVVLAETAAVVFKPLPLSAGVSQIAVATTKHNTNPLVRSVVAFAESFS